MLNLNKVSVQMLLFHQAKHQMTKPKQYKPYIYISVSFTN
jgi:hypothetical protein